MVKQLKTRYNDGNIMKRFVIGVDRATMKLYDCEQSAQNGIVQEDRPVMDNTTFGMQQDERETPTKMPKFKRRQFA